MFAGGKEAKQELAAEKRNMEFTREQNTINASAPEEQTEIMNQEGKSDLLKWQQDLDPELERIAYRLTGWQKSGDSWTPPAEGKVPLCNNRFMDDVVAPQLEPFLTKNLINTNLTEERILLNLMNTSNDIASNMADGYDRYDIDFINFDIVLRILKNTMCSSMFRALNGWTKKTDSTIFKRLETTHGDVTSQQGGLFRRAK